MGNIFVSIFLINTSSNVLNALLYNLFIAITILAGFFILGPFSEKHKKLGIVLCNILNCILYGGILFLGERSGNFVWILGLISGLAQGFYWLSINILLIDLIKEEDRKGYNSLVGIINSLSTMIGPIISAAIISRFIDIKGYLVLFAVILVIIVITLILTFFIKDPPSGQVRFSLKKTYAALDLNEFNIVMKITWKSMFRDGVIAFLLNILIYDITKSEMMLGWFTAFMTVVSIITFWIAGKTKVEIKKLYILGVIFQIISVVILTMYFKNIYSILIYLIIYGIASPLNTLSYGVMVQNSISRADKAGEYRCELSCLKEVWIGVGRITAIIFIILLYYKVSDFSLIWIYGILAAVISALSLKDIRKLQ